jgi:hypothetical protein
MRTSDAVRAGSPERPFQFVAVVDRARVVHHDMRDRRRDDVLADPVLEVSCGVDLAREPALQPLALAEQLPGDALAIPRGSGHGPSPARSTASATRREHEYDAAIWCLSHPVLTASKPVLRREL